MTPRRAQWMIAAVGVGLVAGLVWAAFGELGQVVRAPGQIIARTRTQSVQAANDGVIDRMLVREGDSVRAGQLLARLDGAQAGAAMADSRGRVAALEASLARLRAEALGEPLSFPAATNGFPDFVRNQRQLYAARQRALNAEVGALNQNLELVRQQIRISAPLVEAGDMGRLELISLQQREAEILGAISSRRNRYFSEAQTEMARAEEELSTQSQVMADRSAVYGRMEIRAPVDGLVRRVDFGTPGARVRAGDVVLELVPTGGDLVFEAKLLPRDRSALRVGMAANVKLDGYDYTIYGRLPSKVIYISPDAIAERGPQGERSFYQVWIDVGPATVSAWNRGRAANARITAEPGMSGSVDIGAGQRTVLSYLLKPVVKTLSNSLGER